MTIPAKHQLWILLRVAFTFSLVGLCWRYLAPTQVGGQTAYVVVTGSSMEPFLHRGDLAIVRQSAEYEIGDVVTYRHPRLGQVIHRIIGREGQDYVLKGDNNSWIDSHQPEKGEVTGKMRLRIPKAGSVVWGFRTPLGAAILAGVLGFLLFWPDLEGEERKLETG